MVSPDAIGQGGTLVKVTPRNVSPKGSNIIQKSQITTGATTVIGGLDEQVKKKVIAVCLKNADDPYLRKGILATFGQLHAMEAREIIVKATQDPDEEIRSVAVAAFSRLSATQTQNDATARAEQGKIIVDDGLDVFVKSLSDPTADVRLKAVYALGESGDARAVDLLMGALHDNDEGIKRAAIKELARYNDEKILGALAPFLSSKTYAMRREVPDSFGTVAKKSAHDEVNVCRDNMNRRVLKVGERIPERGSTVRRLVHPVAVGLLIETFYKADLEGKLEILDLFPAFEDKRTGIFIVKTLDDPAPRIRAKAVMLIPHFFGGELIPKMLKMSRDSNDIVRTAALDSLGKYDDPRLPDVYRKALQDPSVDVKRIAVWHIKEKPDKRAVDALLQLLSDPDKNIIIGAMLALGSIRDGQVYDPLLRILGGSFYKGPRSQDMIIRKNAVEALGMLGKNEAVPSLLKAMDERELQPNAIKALGLIGDRRAVPVLKGYLYGENTYLRDEALQALSKIGDPSVLDYYQTVLKGKDAKNKCSTVMAIGKLHDQRALPVLLDVLEHPDEQAHRAAMDVLCERKAREAIKPFLKYIGNNKKSEWISVNVARCLRNYKLQEMTDILIGYLNDVDGKVRIGAVIVLGELGDKKAVSKLEIAMESSDQEMRVRAEFSICKIERKYDHRYYELKKRIYE